jgi:ABC-type bacteriocin/lantibiotic exporter with double-glycine peptidase domain
MNTAVKIYLAFIATIATGIVALMFMLEPKMVLPGIVGMILFITIIILFYKVVSKKSQSEQNYIAKRNGRIAQVLVVVLLVIFFVTAAKHNNVSVIHFIRLWFGF